MGNTLLLSLTFLVLGLLASAVWVFIVGFGGVPGTVVVASMRARATSEGARAAALFLVVAGQLFTTTVWTVFVVESAHAAALGRTGFERLILLACAVIVSNYPGGIAAKDAKPDAQYLHLVSNPQHGAILITVPLTILISLLLALFPSLTRFGFSWVPHLFG